MTLQTIFRIAVAVFTVGNLAGMGLKLNLREAIMALRNIQFVSLVFLWSWVVGPVLAYLITRILPLDKPYAMGLLLAGAAPCAPFYPFVVKRSQGDLAYAGALLLLAAVGTVLMMPLIVPLLIQGLTVSAWAIAKPLLTLVLIPLLFGIALRVYTAPVADKIFPAVKQTASLATLITFVLLLILYGKGMLNSMGSFAIGAQTLFLAVMTLISYKLGFGMKQRQRSIMALGVGTRNIAAVFTVVTAIPNPDPRLIIMVALVFPISAVISFFAAGFFATKVH